MTDPSLPSGRSFCLSVRGWEALLSLPAVVVMAAFIGVLLDLSGSQWRAFLLGTLVVVPVTTLATWRPRARALSALASFLDAAAAGQPSSQQAREGFRAAITLPRTLFYLAIAAWSAAGLLVPAVMWAQGGLPRGLFGAFVVLLAGVSGGLLTSSVLFFTSKRLVAPVREAAAARIADPEERAALVVPFRLRTKLLWVAATSSIVTITFAILLALGQASAPLERLATGWQTRTLEQLAARLEGLDGFEAQRELQVDTAMTPVSVELRLYDPSLEESVPGVAPEVLETLAARVHAGVGVRAGERLDDDHLYAWRQLGDGRIAIMRLPAAILHADLARTRVIFAVLFVVAVGMAATLALLLAHDLRTEARMLRGEVQRMASGDLRRGAVCESEDELGELARAFEKMGGALRATVGRVAETADRVDGATSQLSGASQSVALASADQVATIQQVGGSMDQIGQRVSGLASASQVLNGSVEEASSSILELGASGEELNDTASVLSEKVEEVSSSIEEMMRSIKQVSSNVEALSQASEETSSSMEEMASAMRAVDQTAGETARLSDEVVASAEHGREKVRQTIDGMEEIRVATDVAEQVIRSLGSRATEIGAIVDVIDDVADETNLLALNAAIIAAQAGEHGRAFSVVADEIKELADRVLASTKEIGGLIRSVQEETANAIGAVERGSQSVAGGVERSAEAGVSLEQITRSSRDSGQRIAEIVSAVREQTKAAAHVAELMERVREGVEQIRSAGLEQERGHEVVFRSSVAMREVAQQVRNTTEEQARGGARIRDSIEQVRHTVEGMNSDLQDQAATCAEVGTSTEQMLARTRTNEEAARQMDEAVKALVTQAEALRDDVRRFRI